MYRITSINTGANLGTVDKVVYIKIGESGDFAPATESEAIRRPICLGDCHPAHGRQVLKFAHQLVKAGFVGFQSEHLPHTSPNQARIRFSYFLRVRFFFVWT